MAKATSTVDAPETTSDLVDGTPVKFYGPDKGTAVLAAWQGLYHLFGARATFRVTKDGIFVDSMTVDPKYDADTIVDDISKHNRRLELIPAYFWAQGDEPDEFDDVSDITAFMVQYFRGSVEENSSKTPGYLKDAVADYKATRNMLKKRGPKRKVFRLDSLEDIDEQTLAGINPEALARLKETLDAALAAAK
jgi:hypothetical protein